MKKSKVIDPKGAFRYAESFQKAAQHIWDRADANREFDLIPPGGVMHAFAMELYLKCLICIETGKNPPYGHKLKDLFGALSMNSQMRIKKDYAERTKTDPVFIALGKKFKDAKLDFDSQLASGSNAFDELRYGFEEPPKVGWMLAHAQREIRRIILEKKPEWAKP